MTRLSTLLLPLALTPAGSFSAVSSRDRVLQGAALFFGTPRGARCLVPEFGYPPLYFYEGDLGAWAADCERGLELVQHVVQASLSVALAEDGIIRGSATLTTDAGEEIDYEFTVHAA